MIYQKKARTQTVSEIPHIYVKEALDRLYGRTETVAGGRRSQAPGALGEGPEPGEGRLRARPARPAGWDPLPHDVTWVAEKGKDAKSAEQASSASP